MVDKVLHSQMPFTTGGQTINDRLTAAYHSVAGSQMGKTICKATTEEPIGPKKKHLDYLIHCTHEPNVNIPQLANTLVERTTNSNWCVVFKSLITIHNLMCYGNERFSQYLASSNANFNLDNFLDKASVQGYDMSTYVRRYAKYVVEKVFTYRVMAFDFCKIKRGREDGLLRTMTSEKLLKALPALQGQVDALLEFQVPSNDLANGVINSCFILLFRDLIRLFACYNDGVINLLEKYFDMNKKQCREALELYKKFLLRMDKVAAFLKVAESVGIDRGEIPDLAKAPSSLLEALEQHVNSLDGQKVGGRISSPISGPSASTQSAIQTFSIGYSEPKSGYIDPTTLDEGIKRQILEEEEQRLNLLKEQRLRELEFSERKEESRNNRYTENNRQNNSSKIGTEVFGGLSANIHSPISNHFGAVDDLLSLEFVPVSEPPNVSTNPFITDVGYYQPPEFNNATTSSSGHLVGFANDTSFAKAFGSTEAKKYFVPLANPTPASNKLNPDSTLLGNDLDTSLANLAENFTIGKGQESLKSKSVQWGTSKLSGQLSGPVAGAGYNAVSWNSNSHSQKSNHPTSGYSTILPTTSGTPSAYHRAPSAFEQSVPTYSMYPSAYGSYNNAGSSSVPTTLGYPKTSQFGTQDPFGAL